MGDTFLPTTLVERSSNWQRGINENTNGLLRQYFPKGTELAGFTEQQLDAVAADLNERPRKRLQAGRGSAFPTLFDVIGNGLLR